HVVVALSERRHGQFDDVDAVEQVLARFAQRMQTGEFVLADDARAALLNYPFPGNVRELENILERAVTLSAGSTIGTADLSLPSAAADGPAGEAAAPQATADSSAALGEQLEDVERQAIVDALEQTRYNKTAAAKLLGLTFRQLRYRIKKLGIET
ncbi:MAG: helix-turn-helix domain-containing protein, partial [Pseudomonadota bacterium]